MILGEIRTKTGFQLVASQQIYLSNHPGVFAARSDTARSRPKWCLTQQWRGNPREMERVS